MRATSVKGELKRYACENSYITRATREIFFDEASDVSLPASLPPKRKMEERWFLDISDVLKAEMSEMSRKAPSSHVSPLRGVAGRSRPPPRACAAPARGARPPASRCPRSWHRSPVVYCLLQLVTNLLLLFVDIGVDLLLASGPRSPILGRG